jgi:hypothetical protein
MNNNNDDIMTAANRSMDLAVRYGVNETNPLWTSEATHENVDYNEYVTLGDPRLKRIVRLRLLTEPGYPYMDISYCYGQLKDGRFVRLSGAPMNISRRKPKADLIAWAREEGVNAKALGLLDDNNWSILR